ncbi:helix-turn-helix transcriptional regulator [Pseudonocardia sp.]|uniref:helix-turn-helix transcriptional regulator n=1 Tax=Pseudonocardia sp. TaxID=60912 RepID=UPI002619A226|nr:LuxR family transcriptional regulator [Pseudonocardia sp.]MCW2722333.1 LuxR family transcriptional regulator [Pseudonocardia sp.]
MARTTPAALHGRDPELALVREALSSLRSGVGVVVVIEGAPGMGKSRLLAEAMRMAARRSVAVGLGEADPSEAVVELAPLLRALFDGPQPLLERSALPAIRSGPEQRYWLVQDLESLLEGAVAVGPVLVCLDDLQWADGGTLAALRALPLRLESVPVAWILAARAIQPGSALDDLVEQLTSRGAQKIILKPLTPDAVAELASEVMEASPDQALLELAADAVGNPFFLVELLQGLLEERLVRIEDGVARLVQARLPKRVAAGMRHRLARLSESARQLAVAAASLGRGFTVGELASMLGAPATSLLTPVEQLIEASVFAERADRLAFRHDIIREAVRESTTVSARRALDRQAVDVLLAAGAIPVEVASQVATSAEPGDEVAVGLLMDAADALGPRDPAAAAELSCRALDLIPAGHRAAGSLVATTTILLHAAGRVNDAQAFARKHLRNVVASAEEAAVWLSLASMFALSPDVRVEAGRRALALRDLSDEDRAQHQARLAYNLIQAGRPREATHLLQEARATIERAGDLAARSILRLAEGALLYVDGHFDAALEVHEQVMLDGFGRGETTREWVARQWRSELLAVLDRFDESLELISAGIAAANRERQAFALDFFETWRGRQLFQTGYLPDAATALESRFDAAGAMPVAGALYAAGVVALGRVAIHTGDERHKRETAALARAMLADGTPANRGHGGWLLALTAMADGRPADARAVLDAARSGSAGSVTQLYPVDVTDDPQLVRIALAAGDPRLATDTVAAAEERARRNPGIGSVRAAAAHARGLLDADAASLAEACRLFDAGPRPLPLASALEDLGGAQVRAGAPALGVDTLGRALVRYTEVGATWDAGRVRRRLRANGVRRRLVTSTRPNAGWAALTGSELAVVRLIAQGLTNRETAVRLFVSPHTVNSHLRHAFTKLGVNSRVELARVAAAHAGEAALEN